MTEDPPRVPGSRYRFLEEIGRGGMGAVRRGVDDELGRDVALEVLHERHAADLGVRRRSRRPGWRHPSAEWVRACEEELARKR